MKRIMQVEIKTADEWGRDEDGKLPFIFADGGVPYSAWVEADQLVCRVVNPRTGDVLMFDEADERWLAE